MKNLRNIIKGATLSAALFLGLSLFANDISMVCPYNTYTNLLSTTTPLTVSAFTIANGTGTNTYVQFNDSSTTNLYYTNNAYSVVTYATGSVTNIYTNYFGVLTTNTYTALIGTSNYVASNNIPNNILLGVAVPANATTVINGLYRFFQGIQITNGLGAVTVTATLKQ